MRERRGAAERHAARYYAAPLASASDDAEAHAMRGAARRDAARAGAHITRMITLLLPPLPFVANRRHRCFFVAAPLRYITARR